MLLSFLRFVDANMLEKLDSSHLGHVNSLHDVHLLANVLNGVIGEQSLVFARHKHKRDSSLV